MFHRYQTKLVVFFSALFAAVQVVTLVAVYSVTKQNVHAQIQEQLDYASRIFKLQIEDRTRQHALAARILAADFGFRDAVTSSDSATIQSAIDNLGARIKADRILLVSLDDRVISDTQRPQQSSKAFNYPSLIEYAEKHGEANGMVIMNGMMYEVVVVPVLAPTPVAWICIGSRIDDAFANRLKLLSPLGLDISFAYQRNNDWTLAASTLNASLQAPVSSYLDKTGFAANQTGLATLGAEDYMTLVAPLDAPTESGQMSVVLQYALSAGSRPYQPLLMWLLMLTGAGLLVSLVGGVVIAGSVTKPVRKLAEAARRLELGDYTQTVHLAQNDEVGKLADTFNHMTERIAEREELILYQAQHDVVTTLPNRTLFESALAETIASTPRDTGHCSVLLVYVDRFADIRNILGHEVSDRLIGKIGARLQDAVRESGMLARLATDEFVMLARGFNDEGLRMLAERLLGAFDSPFDIDGVTIDVGAHLGVASYPTHGEDADTLLKHADVAMAEARRCHRSYAFYSEQSDIYSRSRLSLMSELRAGLERNEFQLYYQPIVDLGHDRVTHVEALVRWHHPRSGFMPPDEFIPLAEETGHIQRLTAWSLEQAIAQCSAWRKAGTALSVSVNLSARDLPNRRLPELIAGLLHRHSAQAHWLTLEITESALMREPEQTLHVLRTLRDMGLRLSIDDFGTGYSSMAYLKKLPVDELKIDKSFVLGLSTSVEDELIVRSTIDLGHNFGLKVTAEGVEDQAALGILKRLGCDKTQGYLFNRPQPAHVLSAWIADVNREGISEVLRRERVKLIVNAG